MAITVHFHYKKTENSSFLFLSPRTFNEVACKLTKRMSLISTLNSGFICQKPKLISGQS